MAAASLACKRSSSGLCAAPAADGAGLRLGNLDSRLDSKGSFFKSDLQIEAQVRPALIGTAPSTATGAEHISDAEEVAQNVLELRERGGIESAKAAGARHTRMAE